MKEKSNKQVWDGSHYSNHSSLQNSAGKNILESLKLKGDETILDIGCGTGALAAYLAQAAVPNGHVTGIDSDISMIQTAQSMYYDIANLKIIKKNAVELDNDIEIKSSYYDAVISVYCLHWICGKDAMQRALNGIQRCLKPEGKLVAVFAMQDSDRYPVPELRLAHSLIYSDKWKEYYKNSMVLGNSITIDEYQEILLHSGLQGTVQLYRSPAVNLFKEDFKKALRALPITYPIPEHLKEEFLEEIISLAEAHGIQNQDGTYQVSLTSGIMSAYKCP